jgi:hypothetical protein
LTPTRRPLRWKWPLWLKNLKRRYPGFVKDGCTLTDVVLALLDQLEAFKEAALVNHALLTFTRPGRGGAGLDPQQLESGYQEALAAYWRALDGMKGPEPMYVWNVRKTEEILQRMQAPPSVEGLIPARMDYGRAVCFFFDVSGALQAFPVQMTGSNTYRLDEARLHAPGWPEEAAALLQLEKVRKGAKDPIQAKYTSPLPSIFDQP